MQAEDRHFQPSLFPLLVLPILTLILQDRYYLSFTAQETESSG